MSQEDNICPACGESIQPNDSSNHLNCGHKIHRDCLLELFVKGGSSGNKCPLCRTPFTNLRPVIDIRNNKLVLTNATYRQDGSLQTEEDVIADSLTGMTRRLERREGQYRDIMLNREHQRRLADIIDSMPERYISLLRNPPRNNINLNSVLIDATHMVINGNSDEEVERFIIKNLYNHYVSIFRRSVNENIFDRIFRHSGEERNQNRIVTIFNNFMDNEQFIENVLYDMYIRHRDGEDVLSVGILAYELFTYLIGNESFDNNIDGSYRRLVDTNEININNIERIVNNFMKNITELHENIIANQINNANNSHQDFYNWIENLQTVSPIEDETMQLFDRNQLQILNQLLSNNDVRINNIYQNWNNNISQDTIIEQLKSLLTTIQNERRNVLQQRLQPSGGGGRVTTIRFDPVYGVVEEDELSSSSDEDNEVEDSINRLVSTRDNIRSRSPTLQREQSLSSRRRVDSNDSSDSSRTIIVESDDEPDTTRYYENDLSTDDEPDTTRGGKKRKSKKRKQKIYKKSKKGKQKIHKKSKRRKQTKDKRLKKRKTKRIR
jgi:hypothetical protein